MKPLISIIIPVYNVEEYLDECLQTVIGQSYPNLEVIIINDGSTDKSLSICQKYANENNNIMILSQDNQGVSASRNKGILAANGKYCMFVDSDDYLDINCVNYLFNIIEKDLSDIAICNFEVVGETKKHNIFSKMESRTLSNKEAVLEILYQRGFTHSPWAKLFKMELIKENMFPENVIYEDLTAITDSLYRANKISYGNEPKYKYRIRKRSIMRQNFDDRKFDLLKQIAQFESDLNIIGDNDISKAYKSLKFSLLCHLFFEIPTDDCFYARKKMLFDEMKTLRMSVLFDSNSRNKNKIATIMSILGYKTFSELGARLKND